MLSYLHSNNVSIRAVEHVGGTNERCLKQLSSFLIEELGNCPVFLTFFFIGPSQSLVWCAFDDKKRFICCKSNLFCRANYLGYLH